MTDPADTGTGATIPEVERELFGMSRDRVELIATISHCRGSRESACRGRQGL
ncbi:hypothetical protein HQ535_10800 [bacterium]|nr:hypothetical protein [bacterium]